MSWTHIVGGGVFLAAGLNLAIPSLILSPIIEGPVPYENVVRVSALLQGNSLFYAADFDRSDSCVRFDFEAIAIAENDHSEAVKFQDSDGRPNDDRRTYGRHTLDHVYHVPDQIEAGGVDFGPPIFLELRTTHVCNGRVVPAQFDRIDLRTVERR